MVPGIRKGAGHALSAFCVLLRPESRGWVKLRSANPADPPRIQINMYRDQGDVESMRRSIRMMREIFTIDPLASLSGKELLPGVDVQSDEQIDAFNRNFTVLSHHASCTCAMGTDEQAVVDPELRVRGVGGLRVVDASVMPRVIGGNTNAPVVMIAEKASDLILGIRPLEQAA